ncbi:hypothetical protein NCCP2495_02100 [Dietzia sp. NCCP-2495]|nr:hypothetical protein NCCP2495_02100 [Dietzia sp. NCCP-2495]
MSVQELQPISGVARSWTEACPVEHGLSVSRESAGHRGVAIQESRTGMPAVGRRSRPAGETVVRQRGGLGNVDRTRPVAQQQVRPRRSTTQAPVAPGRRVFVRPTHAVRACTVEPAAPVRVIDDVPTWALLACGVVLAVLMLVVVMFLGGPTYV